MTDHINTPLRLPCGVELKNRLAKSAMSEGLADEWARPGPQLETLYKHWASSGAALLITGNVQVDRACLENPGNVAIEADADAETIAALKRWATACTSNGTQCWPQLSHAGRQSVKLVNTTPKGCSAIQIEGLPADMTTNPVPLTTEEVKELVDRFAKVSAICKDVGFTGVQLHAAHGYLMSAFLNPKANDRTDEYGGALENRARFLLDSVTAIRKAVGPSFPIGVKLNSADFQKGGMTEGESEQVALWLEERGCDLLEISGGNYESPAMFGVVNDPEKMEVMRESTRRREAYFLEFAAGLKKKLSKMPVMVTGGFRSRAVANKAIESGDCAVIGAAKPFIAGADGVRSFLDGSSDALARPEKAIEGVWWPKWLPGYTTYTLLGGMMTYMRGIEAISNGEKYDQGWWFLPSLFVMGPKTQAKAKALRGVNAVGTHYKGDASAKQD